MLWILTTISLLIPAFSLPATPANLTIYLQRYRNAPLPLAQSTRNSKRKIKNVKLRYRFAMILQKCVADTITFIFSFLLLNFLCFAQVHIFGPLLKPRISSAPCSSASELLRFLSRMAASKPTSWVFVAHDFLPH